MPWVISPSNGPSTSRRPASIWATCRRRPRSRGPVPGKSRFLVICVTFALIAMRRSFTLVNAAAHKQAGSQVGDMSDVVKVGITGVATYLPERTVTSDDVEQRIIAASDGYKPIP